MKKTIVLIFALVYFHSFGQNKKSVSKANDPCQIITLETIKQENVKIYSTNIPTDKPKYKLYYEKFVGPAPRSVITYYLNLMLATTTSRPKSKGVIVHLKNGKSLVRPQEEVWSEPRGDDFRLGSRIVLSDADLALLEKSPIVGFKLSSLTFHVEQPNLYFELFNCLLQKK